MKTFDSASNDFRWPAGPSECPIPRLIQGRAVAIIVKIRAAGSLVQTRAGVLDGRGVHDPDSLADHNDRELAPRARAGLRENSLRSRFLLTEWPLQFMAGRNPALRIMNRRVAEDCRAGG